MAPRHVDAVEIDPRIQEIGVRDHPNRPYDDPRVTRIIDDGRAFLRRSTDEYDLVVFALPDSLTLVSTSANLRLESFLFTTEAFDEVRDRLTDDGMFVMYNFYREDWLPQKIGGDARRTASAARRSSGCTAAPRRPSRPARWSTRSRGGSPPGDGVDPIDLASAPSRATDDWPFLYLRERFIAPYYIAALAIIIVFAVLLVGRAAQRSGTSLRQFSPHFFVLGIAFLLLETKSLATFSLLFGTTWIVNALVFFAVLASVLLAIVVNQRVRFRNPVLLYAACSGRSGSPSCCRRRRCSSSRSGCAMSWRRRSRSPRSSSPTSSSATRSATRRRRTWRSRRTCSVPSSVGRSSTSR